jgi:hypothetical protein
LAAPKNELQYITDEYFFSLSQIINFFIYDFTILFKAFPVFCSGASYPGKTEAQGPSGPRSDEFGIL